MRASSVNQIILKTLGQGQSHLTAQQVYERIRVSLPAVNPSTVYRALERLVHIGQVSVSDIGQGAVVYEIVGGQRHHHLVCQDCGHVTTIDDGAILPFFNEISQRYDFRVATNHLILFGHCTHCKQENSALPLSAG